MDRSILTVTTPAASQDLTTLARVKAELDIKGPESDLVLSGFVTAASQTAANYCNRVFVQETVTELIRVATYVDSASLTFTPIKLYLRRLPVTAIASFVLDTETLVQDTDFEIDPGLGALYRLNGDDQRIAWYFRKIVVTYTAGYTFPPAPGVPDTLPADIEKAVIELVKAMWFDRKRDPAMRSQNQPGLGDTVYWVGATGRPGDLPSNVQMLLANYVDSRY